VNPYYQDDYCTIYHGDCRDIMPSLPKVDLVLTDPPYGVKIKYNNYDDSDENIRKVIVPIIVTCIEKYGRVVLTPGNKQVWKYPPARDIGCWFNPAGTGFGSWGFCLAHIILFYGKDPHPNKMPSSITGLFDRRDSDNHPCIKPLPFITWLVNRASDEGETVLDPFMGSGTTLRAAKTLKRKSIGVELEEKYCEIAARRLARGDNFDNIKIGMEKCKGVQQGFGL